MPRVRVRESRGIDLPFVLWVRALSGSVTAKNFPAALNEAFEGDSGFRRFFEIIDHGDRDLSNNGRLGCERLRIWRQENLQKKAWS